VLLLLLRYRRRLGEPSADARVDLSTVFKGYGAVISSGKRDKVDAKKLAELARGDLLPRQVHLVEGEARALRELISARAQLMQKRVGMVNPLRGYLKQEGVRLGQRELALVVDTRPIHGRRYAHRRHCVTHVRRSKM
jgi:hypothetical protein